MDEDVNQYQADILVDDATGKVYVAPNQEGAWLATEIPSKKVTLAAMESTDHESFKARKAFLDAQ